MKNCKSVLTIFTMLFFAFQISAQVPQKFNYQAVCRDNTGSIIASQSVDFRLSIRNLAPNGTIVYQETQSESTNVFGLVTLEIGSGTVQIGTFNTISWETGDKYFEVEMDLGSGFISMGTTQLLSVPYALHSKTAETITGTIAEADPVFVMSPANDITTPEIANWNSAFGWGNHALAGYLSSYTEIDPLWSASPSFGITNTNIANWNSAYGWGNHANAGYLTSYTEADPIFSASPANGILSTNITNWNAAFGWGNHASAGYLTSFTELDPAVTNNFDFSGAAISDLLQFNGTKWVKFTPNFLSSYTETDPFFNASPAGGITSTSILNWNTAYGWGDHSGLYRPIGYVPDWNEITNNPFVFTTPSNDQLLKYDGTNWVNFTPDYLSSFTELDPKVGANTANYLSKWNGTSLVASSIFDNGKVGIGVANGTYPLEVRVPAASGVQMNLKLTNMLGNGYNAGGSGVGIFFAPDDAAIAKMGIFVERRGPWGVSTMHFLSRTSSDYASADLSNSVMSLTQNGYLGIGITNPGVPLSIKRSSNGTGLSVHLGSETNDAIQFQNTNLISTINAVNETFNFANNGTNVLTLYNNNVGIGTTTPNASAKVEVSSTTGGLLLPRMTTIERNNIASPATSLLIYNITTDCLEMYSANGQWVNIGCGCQLPGSFSSNTASNIAGTSFSANWATSSGANCYFLDVSTTNDFSSFFGVYNNYNVGNVTTYNVTGLICNTTYYYRLRANNSCGTTANSNIITVNSGIIVFNYTGEIQTLIVPSGVTSMTIDARGAKGGTGYLNYGPGGNGARVQTTIAVTPLETIYIYVGGSGGNGGVGTGVGGYNGGGAGGTGNGDGWVGSGGGGSSDIRKGGTSLTNRVVIAGGGGGDSYNTNGGAGGYVGIRANGGGIGGYGGTQSAGGTAGYGGCCNGVLGFGGAGTYHIGGGGGGGLYGGGGGGDTGGGGGGSSYSQGTNTTITDDYQNDNGQIIISYCP